VKDVRQKPIGAGRPAVFFAALMVVALAVTHAAPAAAVEDPWAPGSSWISLRAGYAKMAAEAAPNGAAGYGFGYSRMLSPLWIFSQMSLGANVHHELLGRFGSGALVDVPFSAELNRHFLWSGGMRPYIGVGVSAHFLKGYRFPDARAEVRGGPYLVGGGNVQVNANNALGFDARVGTISDLDETYVWSMKLNYSWLY
jgi:hypothetical protein